MPEMFLTLACAFEKQEKFLIYIFQFKFGRKTCCFVIYRLIYKLSSFYVKCNNTTNIQPVNIQISVNVALERHAKN